MASCSLLINNTDHMASCKRVHGCMNVDEMVLKQNKGKDVVALSELGTMYQSAAASPIISFLWLVRVFSRGDGFTNLGILFPFTFIVKYDTRCYISNYIDMFYSQFMLQCQRIVVRVSHKID